MAQAATMGPPLSPREIRRSGRRSAPSASTSASKSPDSDLPPRQKDASHRSQITSNNSNNNQRHKRPKQEDVDETVDERSKNSAAPSTITSVGPPPSTTNNRTKRKAKDKDKQSLRTSAAGESTGGADEAAGESQEEEQGITRCVCGSTGEDDQDAGEFMVQCETCKVWQHGLCMGFESEDQLHDDDYYCELCKPNIHADLLKKLSKRIRQSSATSHHNASASAPSRASRSHSPSHLLKQPSKRRNTMNSRDAAFDESLKEIIEATAAEAAAHDPATLPPPGTGNSVSQPEPEGDSEEANNRKKRKREDEVEKQACAIPKKRTRSVSTTSDRLVLSTEVRDETPGAQSKTLSQAPALPSKPPRNKRGGRKVAAQENAASVEGDEAPPPKRQANNSRAKAANASKRPPASHVLSHGPGSSAHDHGTRRNQNTGGGGQSAGPSTAEASRAYRNSHAYVVSQQPLFTSWHLPDYLAHLEEMLPTDTPQPLEVRAGFAVGGVVGVPKGRSESLERTMERGVKVKWPSKRMSVGDMNKRVRALVEWVGREQASALDRLRRQEALEKAMVDESSRSQPLERAGADPRHSEGHDTSGDPTMILDGVPSSESPIQEKSLGQIMHSEHPPALTHQAENVQSSATMKMMEELMEELIGFQERFGPGAKSRDRERRPTATIVA